MVARAVVCGWVGRVLSSDNLTSVTLTRGAQKGRDGEVSCTGGGQC